jgi:hypothetical protein
LGIIRQRWADNSYAAHADIIALIDNLCLQLFQHLEKVNFDSAAIDTAITQILGEPRTPQSHTAKHKTPNIDHAPRTTHYEPRTTNHAPRTTNHPNPPPSRRNRQPP